MSIENDTEKTPAEQQAFHAAVILRTNFYRDNYRRVMKFCLILVGITAILMAWTFYERTHKRAVSYYVTTRDGVQEQIFPINQPNLSTNALIEWAVEATTTAYNFNFENADTAISQARIYFTDPGYENFIQALQAAGTLNAVKSKKLVVTAVATNRPIVLFEGPTSEGIYAWRVQLPLLITYQSASEQTKQNVIVTLLIARRPTLESPKGIGIASMQLSTPAQGPT